MRLLVLPLLTLLCAACLTGCAKASDPKPEAGQPTPNTAPAKAAWTHGAMVTSANPYASEAAAEILAAGGHAVEAAIAAHAVLGLVEPQSSGLGGGAFMLVHEHDTSEMITWDGRETAPAGVTEDLFKPEGTVLDFLTAWQSGRAVGVPGTIAMYAASHAEHGRLSLEQVLAPAIHLAREGFTVSPRMAGMLVRIQQVSLLDDHPASAAYFYPDGKPLAAGDVRTNPEYAALLEALAEDGPTAFYEGPVAEAMVSAVAAEPQPGTLALSDLANYQVKRRGALCSDQGAVRLCTAPPPASGVADIMMLGLYDRLITNPDDDAARIRAFVQAQQLAYADRDRYIADPDQATADAVTRNAEVLVTGPYLDSRAARPTPAGELPLPGDPGAVAHGAKIAHLAPTDRSGDDTGTSHLSVIDQWGNAVSLTASVEAPFGSSRFVSGFLLNNELTDFAREPRENGELFVNAPAPGKRPRSSMAPLMVFDHDGNLQMVTGSPGGNSIPAYVAKSLVGVLRWELSVQEAVDLANVIARGQRVRVETGREPGKQWAQVLAEAGFDVQEREGENSGLHAIVVTPEGLQGAADPRREGVAIAVVPN